MGDRHAKSDKNKKILYFDANILYGHSMSQPKPFDKIEIWHGHPDLYMNKFGEILKTPDDSDIDYFVEVDLRYPINVKGKTRNFSFCPENKILPKDKQIDYRKKIKPNEYTKAKKLICE